MDKNSEYVANQETSRTAIKHAASNTSFSTSTAPATRNYQTAQRILVHFWATILSM
jgi:hypothetical protein